MTDKTLDDAIDKISRVFSDFALTTREAYDNLCEGMAGFFEQMKIDYPEAFDEDGALRDDWLLIVGRSKT